MQSIKIYSSGFVLILIDFLDMAFRGAIAILHISHQESPLKTISMSSQTWLFDAESKELIAL